MDPYAAADVAHLRRVLDATAGVTDAVARLDAFLGFFVDGADELMAEQSSCLYVAMLTERQLVQDETQPSAAAAIEAQHSGMAQAVGRVVSQGLRQRTPRDWKWVVFRVATVIPADSATAAIRASSSGVCSGTR